MAAVVTYDSAQTASVVGDVGTVWRRRDVVLLLIRRELRVRYRRSLLGVWWTLLTPMLEMAVLWIVFSHLFRFASTGTPYVVYLLAGVVMAALVRNTIVGVGAVLGANGALLGRIPIAPQLFAVAKAAEMLVAFLVSLGPLVVAMVVAGPGLWLGMPLLAVPAILAACFALGIGLALAPVAVRFPDALVLVGILLTLVTYLAPAFYPLEIVPPAYRWLVEINPLTCFIDGFRATLYEQSLGLPRDIAGMVGYAGVSLAMGAVVFTKLRQSSQIYLT